MTFPRHGGRFVGTRKKRTVKEVAFGIAERLGNAAQRDRGNARRATAARVAGDLALVAVTRRGDAALEAERSLVRLSRAEYFAEHRAVAAEAPEANDYFLADLPNISCKRDRHTLEHPFFSLSKRRDTAARKYSYGNVEIELIPSAVGMPTIWDADVLLYCVSQIAAAGNRGQAVSRRLRFQVRDYLLATGRRDGGEYYRSFRLALDRLRGVSVKTNIASGGVVERQGFGLIDSWRIVERSQEDGRMIAIEIVLSEWLYRAAVGNEVLTLSRDYFKLGALERVLYGLARKHLGEQAVWRIGLVKLFEKSGSQGSLKEFRRKIRRLGRLIDYTLHYEPHTDQVTFRRHPAAAVNS